MGEEKEATSEENGGEEDEKGRKLSVAERRTEQDSHGTERRGSDEAKRTADHLRKAENSTEGVEKDKETQPQAPKKKRVLNQSASEKLVDGGATPRESTNKAADAKQLSAGDLQPARVGPDKERVMDKVALRPSGVERRDGPQSNRETEGQRPSKGQQQSSGASSPSHPPRPPRPLSATQPSVARPFGGRQLNQAESKVLHSSFQVLDNTSSPRKLPTRSPAPLAVGTVGSAAGRKQVEASHSQQSLFSRQPLVAQSRTRLGQSQSQHPYSKPQASFLHTHSNTQSQLHPHSQNQMVSVQEAHRQAEGRAPFTLTFSRLYNLKGLKDKMSKLPAQSKRGSTSSPGQGHKSTS
ncbi:uncharacterized protein AKAME5_002071500 [Lates japonicus]|uniref:Uncharacterized protein n=1 Tax=Lates japonicus TaxID=270547 RepID=A0AAD3N7S2_LATJO|nr:uncharacterized protein AKAME5_002071500 [Lates japonicus]